MPSRCVRVIFTADVLMKIEKANQEEELIGLYAGVWPVCSEDGG